MIKNYVIITSSQRNKQTRRLEKLDKRTKKEVRKMNGILKCFANGKQYNLVRENDTYKIYYDFGRVLFEICTNDEKTAIKSFKEFFGNNAQYERFFMGF